MKKIVLGLLIITSLLLSGCGIFKKKKKCPTCPDWSIENVVEDMNGLF